ncbi:MAG TPA: ribonuclease HI family protein [Candidatus Saccharimonadales bacterium]|nr:ribonuclease HI family protein [Candidatus Saccharimonadales bacterium]
MKEIVVHTDGASRGNPGAAAIAYVIEGLNDSAIEHGQTIGKTTNNQAEYQAMLVALEKIQLELAEPAQVQCFSDSELMVKQLNGQYRVKDALLKPHYEKILGLVGQLSRRHILVGFTAIRRGDNQRADELANIALDGSTVR